uniref:Uncharacterized protein n=1 Tax=Plectus sambesii TaxID=2011161 RepID=A0A914VHZ6_9BILA
MPAHSNIVALTFILLTVIALHAEATSAAKSRSKRRVGGYGAHQVVSGGARQASDDVNAAFIRMPTTIDQYPAGARMRWGKRFFRTAEDVLTDAYPDGNMWVQ